NRLGLLILTFCFNQAISQSKNDQNKSTSNQNKKLNFKVLKDSLDGKLDMSDFLIDYHGFIPVPQIITEPALGSIGIMLAPVFIHPNNVNVKDKYIPPDITAAFIGYTGNKSWGFGAMRMATLPNYHLKYRAGAVYGDVNMDFYRTFPFLGEQRFDFN